VRFNWVLTASEQTLHQPFKYSSLPLEFNKKWNEWIRWDEKNVDGFIRRDYRASFRPMIATSKTPDKYVSFSLYDISFLALNIRHRLAKPTFVFIKITKDSCQYNNVPTYAICNTITKKYNDVYPYNNVMQIYQMRLCKWKSKSYQHVYKLSLIGWG